MESKEMCGRHEDTIDLLHMAVSVLKKWRGLLLAIVIGGLLGCVWQLLPGESEQAPVEPVKLSDEMYLGKLYHDKFAKSMAYVEQSALMKMDSHNVYFGDMMYYIDDCEQAELVAAYFETILDDEGVRDALCEALQITCRSELPRMAWSDADVDWSTLTVGDTELKRDKGIVKLYFGVMAADKKQAQDALNVLSDAVAKKETELKVEYVFSLSLVNCNVQLDTDEALWDMQNDILEDLDDAYFSARDLEDELTSDERTTYKHYLMTGEVEESTAEQVQSRNPKISAKKIILLSVVAPFLACVWYAVRYLLDGNVKTADEAQALSKRNVIACVESTVPGKLKIDRWLDKLAGKRLPAGMPAVYATAAVEKLNNAVIVYDEENEHLQKFVQGLDCDVPAMGLMGVNAESLQKIDRDNQVVMLVKLGETARSQIQQEVVLCSQYDIPLAGVLLLK